MSFAHTDDERTDRTDWGSPTDLATDRTERSSSFADRLKGSIRLRGSFRIGKEGEQINIFKSGYQVDDVGWLIKLLASIRCKTITVLVVLFGALIIGFNAVLFGVFPYNFVQIENTQISAQRQRVTNFLFFQYKSLIRSNNNYYPTSTSANFNLTEVAQLFGQNQTFTIQKMANSLNDPKVLGAQQINIIAFYLPTGQQVFQVGFDLESRATKTTLALPATYKQIVPGVDTFMKQPDNVNFIGTGFIRLDNGKILYAVSTPIYNRVNSIAGFVIIGRVQTSTILKSLADNIGSCLTVVDYTDDIGSFMKVKGLTGTIPLPTTPSWSIDSNSPITSYDNSFVSNRTCAYNIDGNVNPRTMGSILMTDARGKPIQVFRIDTDRTNLLIGIAGIFTTFGVLVIILILLSIVMVIFLDRVALRKVAKITKEIEQITVDSNMHARLSGDKKYPTDEFGVLIHCINKMLVSLEEASQRIQNVLSITLANEERARTIMNSINDYIVCVLTRDGTIAETNPAFADKFKFDLKASKGNTIVEKFIFELKLADLVQMSEQGEIKEGFFLTQFKEKIPVTIKVTATKIVVDDVPTEALVINAQNNAEQNSMMDKLKKMQDDLDFKEMWKTPRRRQAFKDFCVRERSVENVLFVEEVEVYRTIVNVAERYKKQMEILEKYLKPTGEFQVNISATVLQTEGTLIAEGYAQRRLFDKLEKVIMNMMSNDTYRRFKVLPPKEQGMGDDDTDTATTVSIRED